MVELMIVVATVGLLATMAIPGYHRARQNTQNGALISDLHTAGSAFTIYAIENGKYPPDTTPGLMPNGMAEYLKKMRWKAPTPVGGLWDWDYGVFGVTAGVSVYTPTADPAQLLKVDLQIDDGNLGTGGFRSRSQGYISVVEP